MPMMRRVTKATELKRFKELEGEYHYMGETHSGGDTMRLVFEEDGKWVALMVCGSACYHLKPRDAYVGWTNSIRAERLKLVVSAGDCPRRGVVTKRGLSPIAVPHCRNGVCPPSCPSGRH